ncbi:MAG: F0F1 ATP synthase subunit epsilon [Thermodesulfobacteriota bacterium]|nr:F0F1 ATP synthase subunit epsilon [Thermodesulfobacteriota bacterium]
MDKFFLLEIVTPYGLVVSLKVEEAYIPGSQGDFGVLPGHVPFLTSLRIGELHYRRNKEVHFLAINRGFAEVTPTKTTILTDTAEPAEEIDVERAQSAKNRAEEKLKKITRDDPVYLAEAEALERAKVRLRIAEKAPRE